MQQKYDADCSPLGRDPSGQMSCGLTVRLDVRELVAEWFGESTGAIDDAGRHVG